MTKIATINKIAKEVKNNVDKNKKLPSSVDKYSWPKYAYLLAQSVVTPGKDIKAITVSKAPNPSGTTMSRSIDKVDYIKLAKYFVNFVKKNGRIPNYVQFKTYKIRPRLFIYAMAKIVVFYAENKQLPNYCNFNSQVFFATPKVSGDEIFNYFVKTFGNVKTIDEAFSKVKDRGYAYYYDDKYANKTVIDRIKSRWGVNCTDSCQMFWHIAKALGYEVRCIHVQCTTGGHVRLQLKHSKYTEGNWINRDPAAILSDNGQPLTYIWCANAPRLAVNPNWFLENVNR